MQAMQPSEALIGLVSLSLSQPESEMAAEQLQYMPEKSAAGMSSSATTPAPAAPRTDASLTVPRLWASFDLCDGFASAAPLTSAQSEISRSYSLTASW
jgi:hypothetical protein